MYIDIMGYYVVNISRSDVNINTYRMLRKHIQVYKHVTTIWS